MPAIEPNSLLSWQAYSQERAQWRQRIIPYKKLRTVFLGPHLSCLFEDQLTVRYHIQEMLRLERIADPAGIAHELETYSPLIPNGHNLKATLMIEILDREERRHWLRQLKGIEHSVWLQVQGFERISSECAMTALGQTNQGGGTTCTPHNAEYTTAVHFLCFELTAAQRQAAKQGAPLHMGINHPAYPSTAVALPHALHMALMKDFDAGESQA